MLKNLIEQNFYPNKNFLLIDKVMFTVESF